MDCNIRCCTLVILVALVATCVPSEILCQDSKTSGYTVPSGDIFLESGRPLDINCTLHSTLEYNSSSLVFYGLGEKVSDKYLHIVNETTLRLYKKHPKIQDGMYVCKLKTEKGYTAVCLNKVIVGCKPKEVENFSCVSHNWENLNCSWIPPHNFIRTNYTASFKYGSSKSEFTCPQNVSHPNTCFLDFTTNPTYRQGVPFIKFYMTGSNVLGSAKWDSNVSHFSVVIPDKPNNLTSSALEVDSITLHWLIPLGLENFPPGVIHQVRYKTDYDEEWQEVDTSSLCVKAHGSQCSKHFNLTLSNLKYPNTVYNISVRSRTGKEGAHPYKWSEPAFISSRTLSTLPAFPPRTEIGSFEVVSTNGHGQRSVNLYWQDIPKYYENGNDFQYKILSVEENGIVKNILPKDITRDSATFPNLTNNRYHFKIISSNEIGSSVNYSEITVPADYEIPLPPEQVTQIPYTKHGVYEVSWEKPLSHSMNDSYTVFWCQNRSNRSQCSNLNWTVVGSDVNMKNNSFLSESRLFQGVSANRGGLSSGIVWASCTILPGREGAVMKPPNIEHPGPSYMYLTWKHECSNRIGPVLYFEVDYCLMEHCSENSICENPKKIKIQKDKRSFNITGLQPYSEYAILISVQPMIKDKVISKAQCFKTLEGVPDMIETVIITNISNSSMSLVWFPPKNFNGVLTRYLIQWGGQPKNVTDNTPYNLEDLESSKEYNISISACTATGCGIPSIVKKATTLMGHPGIPANLQFNFLKSKAVFSWSTPTTGAGNFTYYNIAFELYSGDTKKFFEEINVTSTKVILPWEYCEADGQTRYRLKVRAVNLLKNNNTLFIGDWSDLLEDNCAYITTPTHLSVVIPLIAVLLSLVLCIFCAVFSQHLWVKFNQMRDIGVKLPARLGTRQEDKSENHAIHIWNNHMVRETDNNLYRPSPDQQSLLKIKEEIEMVQDDNPNDRDSFGCDIIQNSAVCGNPDSPVTEPDTPPIVAPSPGYILVSPQPSGYVTIPPLSRGYIMATLPPSPNPVSPSLPQCSIASLKQNGFNSIGPKPCNSFPEPNHLYGGDMVSPINST